MTINEFKQRVLEEKLFLELKDKSVVNSDKFRKEYKGLNINHSRLYVRIINYQVKKYGCSLDNDKFIQKIPEEEMKVFIQRKRQRDYYRRNK